MASGNSKVWEFTNDDARAAVENEDFSQSIYVNTSGTNVTKKAYSSYETQGFRICVVGDVHRNDIHSPWNIAGNSFIPGWDGWHMPTSPDQVAVIGPLPDQVAFPGNNRYPDPLEVHV